MTVYVDETQTYPSGRWCHMATDGDIEELHVFAEGLGLKRSWFQRHRIVPHYDLRPSKSALAQKKGAVLVSSKELLERCRIIPPVGAKKGAGRDERKEEQDE